MMMGLGRHTPSSLHFLRTTRRFSCAQQQQQQQETQQNDNLITDWGMKKNGFWGRLDSPFFGMAPLFDVTDPTFRRLVAHYGKPDIMWTEFVSASGLSHPEGTYKVRRRLKFTPKERPILAQLFTSEVEDMYKAAKLCQYFGFDGIDINMGCPDKAVIKQRAGGGLILEPEKAVQLLVAAQLGADRLPISVKTRVGFRDPNEFEDFFPHLLLSSPLAHQAAHETLHHLKNTFHGDNRDIEYLLPPPSSPPPPPSPSLLPPRSSPFCVDVVQPPTGFTIHFRTVKEMSKVPAHWEEDIAGKAIKMVRSLSPETKIIGNGDVFSLSLAHQLAVEWGLDGIMIGRGAIGNPMVFNPLLDGWGRKINPPTSQPSTSLPPPSSLFLTNTTTTTATTASPETTTSSPPTTTTPNNTTTPLPSPKRKEIALQLMIHHINLELEEKKKRKEEEILEQPHPPQQQNEEGGVEEEEKEKEGKGVGKQLSRHLVKYIDGLGGAKVVRGKVVGSQTTKELVNYLEENLQGSGVWWGRKREGEVGREGEGNEEEKENQLTNE